MIKKIIYVLLMFLVLLPVTGRAENTPDGLVISGQVKWPSRITLEGLSRMQSVTVRLNEVDLQKNFKGAFQYQGIPLRTLLEQAGIHKEKSNFNKPIDLAVLVKTKSGKQIVLSWGELFYRNPAEITVAFSAVPIMPHKKCESCHKPEVYERWLSPIKRSVGFPKLIVANDFYTDRSLEDIAQVEVIDLRPALKGQKISKLHSPSFDITGSVKNPLKVTELSSYNRVEMVIKQIGDGMGYHGLKWIEGVPLRELLDKAGAEMDPATVILISAPDGYRSLLSYGELYLSQAGNRILVADKINHKPLDKDGKFFFVPPDDLAADRDVKAVSQIEVITLK
ncbi:MAG TPA: hypothetical protein VK564_09735 [Thermodesulfobacteriota bacterium]|nr:hypothetical protein [Thermodesulfobacteriota bacterium]